MGPLIVFAGVVSYFVVFAHIPALRDVPWLNLSLVLGGIVVCVVGLWRAFAESPSLWGRIFAVSGLLLSLAIAGLFVFYVFALSYRLPEPSEETARLDVAPDFTLNDQHGRPVALNDYRGRNVVLVFYRGHW